MDVSFTLFSFLCEFATFHLNLLSFLVLGLIKVILIEDILWVFCFFWLGERKAVEGNENLRLLIA